MSVWIVFEYIDNGSKIVGVYQLEAMAKEEHGKSPTWRYIEEYEVQ